MIESLIDNAIAILIDVQCNNTTADKLSLDHVESPFQ